MSVEGGFAGISLDITTLYTPDNDLPETVYSAVAFNTIPNVGIPLAEYNDDLQRKRRADGTV